MDMETVLRAEIRRLTSDLLGRDEIIQALRSEIDTLRLEDAVIRPRLSELQHKLALAENHAAVDPSKAETAMLPVVKA